MKAVSRARCYDSEVKGNDDTIRYQEDVAARIYLAYAKDYLKLT